VFIICPNAIPTEDILEIQIKKYLERYMNHLRMNITDLTHAIPYTLNNFPFKINAVSKSKNVNQQDFVEVKFLPNAVVEAKEE